MKRTFLCLLAALMLLCACAAPAEPALPAEPAAPTEPVEPMTPIEPEIPTEPEKPAQPETPATPTEPEKPAEAEKPAQPAAPAQPVTPPAPPKPVQFPPLLEEAVEELEDEHANRLNKIDFEALKKQNKDTKGWIYLPGTVIDYPIVQSKDNEYYLNRTYEGKWNTAVGAIYLDYRNNATFEDFNTIIYGHDLKAGTMFSTLNNYIDDPADYHTTHPSFYIATEDGRVFRYDVFAACEAPAPGATWRLGLEDFEARQAYIEYCLYYNTNLVGIAPAPTDHIITLSTCTGRGHHSRCVVQLVRAEEF